MPKIKYEDRRFNDEKLYAIAQVNRICERYAQQGYDVTLRQVYYRFVAMDLFPDSRKYVWTGRRWQAHPAGTKNAEPNYKWLGEVINDGRMAGLIDWDYIIDRTRNLRYLTHFNSPEDALSKTADRYYRNLWEDQPEYVEVWVEKDALVGIVNQAATALDTPFFSCRGYTSQSEMWGAAQRIGKQLMKGRNVTLLHLGDHDPSGIDMTRDIRDRLTTFIRRDQVNTLSATAWKAVEAAGINVRTLNELQGEFRDKVFDNMRKAEDSWGELTVDRIALNMDQIEEHEPPPNPAKLTDPRAQGYIEEYGDESWELDALPPEVLDALIQSQIADHIDDDRWQAAEARQESQKALIEALAANFEDVESHVQEQGWVV